MTLEERITVALRRLGDTPGEVASNLHATHCLGEKRVPTRCPVSRYLAKAVPILASYAVRVGTPGTVSPTRWDRQCMGRDFVVTLPGAVNQFVANFDAGVYPDLDEVEHAKRMVVR